MTQQSISGYLIRRNTSIRKSKFCINEVFFNRIILLNPRFHLQNYLDSPPYTDIRPKWTVFSGIRPTDFLGWKLNAIFTIENGEDWTFVKLPRIKLFIGDKWSRP